MSDEPISPGNGINTYNEKPLHAALKQWYAAPDDQIEVRLDGYFIDLIHDGMLVEIQTKNFNAIRKKLYDLCQRHPVRLVYPVAAEKWIRFLPEEEGGKERRRKSPLHLTVEYLFKELVYLPGLIQQDHFSIEVLLIQEEEVRRYSGRGWRRKGWVTEERRLVGVLQRRLFETPDDLATLLPIDLKETFTVKELANAARQPEWLARKMIYCYKAMGVLDLTGKRGRSHLYTRLLSG